MKVSMEHEQQSHLNKHWRGGDANIIQHVLLELLNTHLHFGLTYDVARLSCDLSRTLNSFCDHNDVIDIVDSIILNNLDA